VELVLAATIVAILMVGLGVHLRGAMMVWRRTTDTLERLQRERVALERIGRDLANAFVYDGSDHARVQHAFGAREAKWITMTSSTAKGPAVRSVAYRCATAERGTQLLRSEQTPREASTGVGDVSESVLLPGCEGLAFRYAFLPEEGGVDLLWQEQWPYLNELPRLIEVTITSARGRALRVVFANPSGSLCREGAETHCQIGT
jgi:hypothetical protein